MNTIKYAVDYSNRIENKSFKKFFCTHPAAKSFSAKKKNEPGWIASWPRKIKDGEF